MKVSQAKRAISEELRPYVEHRQRVKAEGRSRLKKRHQSGLKQAKELADILKTEFGATKVVLFGSMLSVNDTHMSSDIDLAVWNLPLKDYLDALSALIESAREFSVDLVRVEEASDSLLLYIAKAGLVLGDRIPESDTLTRDNPSMPNYGVITPIGLSPKGSTKTFRSLRIATTLWLNSSVRSAIFYFPLVKHYGFTRFS